MMLVSALGSRNKLEEARGAGPAEGILSGMSQKFDKPKYLTELSRDWSKKCEFYRRKHEHRRRFFFETTSPIYLPFCLDFRSKRARIGLLPKPGQKGRFSVTDSFMFHSAWISGANELGSICSRNQGKKEGFL